MISPYCTLLFWRKEIAKFSEVALVSTAVAWSVALWSREDIGLEILPILQRMFACLLKAAIKTIKENVKFVQKFFIRHLAALRPTLATDKEATLLIQCKSQHCFKYDLKVTRSLVIRLGPKTWPSASVGFKPETFRFRVQRSIPLCHSLQKCTRNNWPSSC